MCSARRLRSPGGAGGDGHRRDRHGTLVEDRVDDADEILDADERATHVVACEPDGHDLGCQILIPAVGEPGYRVALAAHAFTDDDPAEPDRRVLGPPGLDELVER